MSETKRQRAEFAAQEAIGDTFDPTHILPPFTGAQDRSTTEKAWFAKLWVETMERNKAYLTKEALLEGVKSHHPEMALSAERKSQIDRAFFNFSGPEENARLRFVLYAYDNPRRIATAENWQEESRGVTKPKPSTEHIPYYHTRSNVTVPPKPPVPPRSRSRSHESSVELKQSRSGSKSREANAPVIPETRSRSKSREQSTQVTRSRSKSGTQSIQATQGTRSSSRSRSKKTSTEDKKTKSKEDIVFDITKIVLMTPAELHKWEQAISDHLMTIKRFQTCNASLLVDAYRRKREGLEKLTEWKTLLTNFNKISNFTSQAKLFFARFPRFYVGGYTDFCPQNPSDKTKEKERGFTIDIDQINVMPLISRQRWVKKLKNYMQTHPKWKHCNEKTMLDLYNSKKRLIRERKYTDPFYIPMFNVRTLYLDEFIDTNTQSMFFCLLASDLFPSDVCSHDEEKKHATEEESETTESEESEEEEREEEHKESEKERKEREEERKAEHKEREEEHKASETQRQQWNTNPTTINVMRDKQKEVWIAQLKEKWNLIRHQFNPLCTAQTIENFYLGQLRSLSDPNYKPFLKQAEELVLSDLITTKIQALYFFVLAQDFIPRSACAGAVSCTFTLPQHLLI